MVVINWLIQLAISETLSENLFKLKGDSIWFVVSLGDYNKNVTGELWGKDIHCIYFSFMGGPTLIEDLVGSCFVRLWGYSWLDVIRLVRALGEEEPIFNWQFSRREAKVKYAKFSWDCGPRPLVFPCHILSAPNFLNLG